MQRFGSAVEEGVLFVLVEIDFLHYLEHPFACLALGLAGLVEEVEADYLDALRLAVFAGVICYVILTLSTATLSLSIIALMFCEGLRTSIIPLNLL